MHVSDRVALRASAYGGFRAPSLNELYRPFRVGNVLTQGNPNLGPERLLGGELGLNHAASSSFSWRATAFWDRVEDPIANVTLSVTPALITRQRQNLGRARVRGVSVEADFQPVADLRLQASYVLSDARVHGVPGRAGNRGQPAAPGPAPPRQPPARLPPPRGAQREPARPLREPALRRRPESPAAGQPLRGRSDAGPPVGGVVGSVRLGREPLRSTPTPSRPRPSSCRARPSRSPPVCASTCGRVRGLPRVPARPIEKQP